MAEAGKPLTYDQAGVNYEDIDYFKREAQAAAASTGKNLEEHGYHEIPESRGESVFVWDIGTHFMAGVLEGLGTKNLVADAVDEEASGEIPTSHYGAIGQDTMAMMLNDLITSGAKPLVTWMHVAAGESKWFKDPVRAYAYNLGIAAVCNELSITWAGGESPGLPGIIVPGAAELSGFLLGEIKPKQRYVRGDEVEPGDAVVLVESSGIHANGLTAVRTLATERLALGYNTPVNEETTLGEALLTPTHLYSKLVDSLLDNELDVHRMENITGHGWRKLMRAREEFTYRMHTLPPSQAIFEFLQQHLGVDDEEMFGNYNMGAGFAIYLPANEAELVIKLAAQQGFQAWEAGRVEEGPKQVIVVPKDLVYAGDSLDLR